MRYAAFDLGASSGKLHRAAFDGRTLSLQLVYRFDNALTPLGDGLYWDFLSIYRHLAEGLRAAAVDGFDSLGIDSFNNDFSFIDAAGELLFPVRAYRDERTDRYAEKIYQTRSKRQLYGHSGNQIAPFNTLMQLAAMREAQQDYLFEHAHKLLMLPDLLAYYLTGETVCEYTLAAETQLLNLQTRDWIDELLVAYGIPRRLFAPIVLPATRTGQATPRYRAQQHLPPFDFVSVCQHDTASAFLASPVGANAAILSSGTWALVGMEVEAPIITDYGFACNIANEGGLPGHHRLLKNVMGSWILQELQRDYRAQGIDYDFPAMQALVLAEKPFEFLIDVDAAPFFAPGDMIQKVRTAAQARDGRAPERPGQLFRLVYEGLSLKYRWAIEALERLSGRALLLINVIGGGAQDALGCQMTADACGRPVLAGPCDASSLGNVLAQMLAQGEIGSAAEGRQIIADCFPPLRYEPAKDAAWDEHYARFTEVFGC